MGEVYFTMVVLMVVLIVGLEDALRYDKCGRKNRRFRRRHHCLCRQCRFGK